MSKSYIDEPMIEIFVFETSNIVESLEQVIMNSEATGEFSDEDINEIFRFMHTIKGSAAMMMYDSISHLAHIIEDAFYIIRDNPEIQFDFSEIIDLILESIDYFKIELMKVKNGEPMDDDIENLEKRIIIFKESLGERTSSSEEDLETIQQFYIRPKDVVEEVAETKKYKAKVFFQEESGMENIRAYTIIHNIADFVNEVVYYPEDIIDDDKSIEFIQKNGFQMVFDSKGDEDGLKGFLENTVFLEKLEYDEISSEEYLHLKINLKPVEVNEEIKIPKSSKKFKEKVKAPAETMVVTSGQSIISVNVDKLDSLMDMVGELVIAEAMVTQNPEITSLEVESFEKASRQLHKITTEVQDLVMAIRMVPLSTTFLKMHRIVRDMSKKLGKKVNLDIIGEETEVDKNIIEKISDPLMHIIRNAIDHGIEEAQCRIESGKHPEGTIRLEAKNSGSDVLVIIKDDGKGLNRESIYQKAYEQGLVNRSIEQMNDREIFGLILAPGFSTKEAVTEYSGRGVGMDVVSKNIEEIGGSVVIDSVEGDGTTITLKIPLTLAIIDGMNIKVGESRFTLPIMTIQESFRPEEGAVFNDPDNNEMIMVRGVCYPILRLHDFYDIETKVKAFNEGILIMVEENDRSCCIFADELLGQQQVVVKSLPEFIKRVKKIEGLGGCTLLGDGNISLILDVGELNEYNSMRAM